MGDPKVILLVFAALFPLPVSSPLSQGHQPGNLISWPGVCSDSTYDLEQTKCLF